MTTDTALMEPTHTLPVPRPQQQSAAEVTGMLPLTWLTPGLVTGVALWACYFPLAQGWLAWVALVPLFFVVRMDASRGRLFWGAFLGGCVFYWPVLQWMRVADPTMYLAWAVLATYCALYVPAAVFLIRFLDRRTALPLAVAAPAVWVGLEYIRSFLLTGFAWYFLGHSQHAYLSVVQIADVTGVYGISFLIAAVNAVIFEGLYQCGPVRRALASVSRPAIGLRMLGGQAGILLVLFLGNLAYGNWRLEQEDFEPGPRVALLQGNVDQRLRNEGFGDLEKALKLEEDYLAMAGRTLKTWPLPDLIVWPETSYPFHWPEPPEDLNLLSHDEQMDIYLIQTKVRTTIKKMQINQLLGANSRIWVDGEKKDRYNSAYLFDGSGNVRGHYDKIHRVPFGEFVPMGDWFPFLARLTPYDFDYGIRAGDKLTRLALGKFHFGVLICFEDTDPFLARRYGAQESDGPPVDFLINISNDGWFDGTSQHEEHLALCRFRAIETRRAVARAVNMGISAIIDSNGRVQKPEKMPHFPDSNFWLVQEDHGRIRALPQSDWAKYKKVEGVLTGVMPIDKRASLYVRWGDWLPLGSWGLIAGCFCWGWRRRLTTL